MSTYPSPRGDLNRVSPTLFEPTAEQLAREKAIRRFRRWYVYFPIGVAVALAVFIVFIIGVGLFAPGLVGAELFISALADIIVIIWIIPMLLLVALPTIAYLAYIVNRRQRRQRAMDMGVNVDRSRVQLLLWRVQQLLDRADQKVDDLAPKMAGPVIMLNALIANVEAWFEILERQFTRPSQGGENDTDGFN